MRARSMQKNFGQIFSILALALILGAFAGSRASETAAAAGTFSVLTYNVAGLPQGISKSQPLFFMSRISPRLNDFDIVVTQEDFAYHRQLAKKADHPYQADRSREGTLGDGLSRFSKFPFGEVTHVQWVKCHGYLSHASDCLTPKGFAMATHEIAPGVKIDIYDLHMDAGKSAKDLAARSEGMDQLIAFMADRSAGKAMIVGGDFNLNAKRPGNLEVLARLLEAQGLSDACRAMGPCEERIDRVLFRSGGGIFLTPLRYQVEKEKFETRRGGQLSDHEAVSVVFQWELLED